MRSIFELRNYRVFAAFLLAAALFSFPAHAQGPAPGQWVLLGQIQANLMKDRDRILVGRSEGKYREIQFTVRGASLEIYEVVVTFANGQQFKPTLRLYFDAKTSSRVIDLPGERRVIQHVDFVFRTPTRREGQATILLYGRG